MCALKHGLFVLFIAQIGTTLVQGETVRGIVLDESGKPASGAHVWATSVGSSHEFQRIDGTSDDRGGFRMEVPPGNWLWNASFGKQSLEKDKSVNIDEGKPPKEIVLNLTKSGALRVQLLEEETGKPIVGGTLALDNGLMPKTDKDGRFEVVSLSREDYHEAIVLIPGRRRKSVLFEMSEKPITELEIRVPVAGKIVGRVLDADGKPIPHAFVGRPASGKTVAMKSIWTKADDQGRFEYDGVSLDAPTNLSANAAGFESLDIAGLRVASTSAPLTVDFRLKLRPGAKPIGAAKGDAAPKPANHRDLYGVVRNIDKKPLEGVLVRWGPDATTGAIEAKTDANGKFKLENVPNAPYFVCAIPPQRDVAALLEPVGALGDLDLDLILEAGHTVKGVLQDARGAPIAGISVLPSLTKPNSRSLYLRDRETKTDAKGRFEINGLAAKGMQFTFMGSGFTSIRDRSLEVDKEHTIVGKPAGVIRGRVVDSDGKPVRSFRVLLNISRQRRQNDLFGGFFAGYGGAGLSFTTDDGTFLIRNLQANSVQRVTIFAPGYGESSIDRVEALPLSEWSADRVLTCKLQPAFNLNVHVVEDSTGKPIPDARVAVIYNDPSIDAGFAWGHHDASGTETIRRRTKADGVASFSPLSLAEGSLIVQAQGFTRHHQGWRDGAKEVTIRLKPAATISGGVIDKSKNTPINGANVYLVASDQSFYTDVTGRLQPGKFQIDELPGDEYQVMVRSAEGKQLYDGKLAIKARETVVLDVEVVTEDAAK